MAPPIVKVTHSPDSPQWHDNRPQHIHFPDGANYLNASVTDSPHSFVAYQERSPSHRRGSHASSSGSSGSSVSSIGSLSSFSSGSTSSSLSSVSSFSPARAKVEVKMDYVTRQALGLTTPPEFPSPVLDAPPPSSHPRRRSISREQPPNFYAGMQDAMGYPVMSTEEDAANLNLGLQSEVRVGGKVLVEVEMRQADVVDKINQMQEKKSRSRQSSNASATLEQVKKLRERSSTLESSIPEEREVKHVESIVPDSPPRAIKIDKDTFVDGLVGTTVLAIQSIWPGNEGSKQASPTSSPSSGSDPVLPLRWFIKEVLRRSRTTCSVLQTALYYLHKSRRSIRDRVVKADKAQKMLEKFSKEKKQRIQESSSLPTPPPSPTEPTLDAEGPLLAKEVEDLLALQHDPVLCGRRMFLASLIAASKFLQDRNYSNKAWAKISGLDVIEINSNERAFLCLVEYRLHVDADVFSHWTERLMKLAQDQASRQSTPSKEMPTRAPLRRTQSDVPTETLPNDIPIRPASGMAQRMQPLSKSHSESQHCSKNFHPINGVMKTSPTRSSQLAREMGMVTPPEMEIEEEEQTDLEDDDERGSPLRNRHAAFARSNVLLRKASQLSTSGLSGYRPGSSSNLPGHGNAMDVDSLPNSGSAYPSCGNNKISSWASNVGEMAY